ncbi:MAG: CsgG/HfaB family protein [Kiritimatiellia bacterium]
MNTRRRLLVIAALAIAAAPSAFALWGKATTATESGNAKMNLGEYKGLKHAIGCKEFENEAGWSGQWEIGRNLTVMLESALFDSGRFVIVEREKLGDVLGEQDLAASGRAAKSKVAKTGLIRSARYIASGAVSEVSENQSGGGAGISFKGVRLGGGKNEAQITVIVKLIDTTTGEIVAKERIVGKAGGTSLNVGLSAGGLNTDLGGFKKTPLGQAAQDCIAKASEFIAKKMEVFPFEGSVVKASGGKVYINRGSDFGMEVGQKLVMITEGETLTDPDTGAILGKEDGVVIGKLSVAKVDAKLSVCEVTEGEKAPAAGTLVTAP